MPTAADMLSRLVLVLVLALGPASVAAQAPEETDTADPARATDPASPESDEAESVSPCALDGEARLAWIDRVQRGLFRAVCGASSWFDGLFGDRRYDEEYQSTQGRLMVGMNWDEEDGVSEEVRFRVDYELPQAEHRVRAFLGRADRDDVVSDRAQRPTNIVHALAFDDDPEWLVGLGYSPMSSRSNRVDFDLGVDLNFPLNPYTKVRYTHQIPRGPFTMWRFRQTVFWENEDGLGTTSRLDFEHLLGRNLLLRHRNVGTYSQGTRGLDWYSELTLYHRIGEERAFGYRLAARGETDHDVPVRDFLAQLVYRERFLRDWLFLDIEPGVLWRRRELGQPRDVVPILTIGVEVVFGNDR